jgi:hypothetical protein
MNNSVSYQSLANTWASAIASLIAHILAELQRVEVEAQPGVWWGGGRHANPGGTRTWGTSVFSLSQVGVMYLEAKSVHVQVFFIYP